MACSKTISFVTGNEFKLEEVQKILDDTNVHVKSVNMDLVEIQAPDSATVAAEKCKLAANETNGPTMVEDTSLEFTALHGLPGAFVKFFQEKLGCDGLKKLLDGHDDHSATAVCAIAYTDGPEKDVIIFEGRTSGTIVHPRGDSAFGWDPIFEPHGSGFTFGQMNSEQKNAISHRLKAVNKLKQYIQEEKQ